MPERVKKTKCGGGVAKKIEGDAGEGKEDKMRGGGCCEKNLRGGYAGEGNEDEMRGGGVGGLAGWRVKIWGGGLDHKNF